MTALRDLCTTWRDTIPYLSTPDSLRSWLDSVAERVVDVAEADGLALTDRDLVTLSYRLPEPLALELLRRRITRELAEAELATAMASCEAVAA